MNRRDDSENVVGLDEDVETLEKMLLRKDDPQQMFISILGESGVGKRTLLQALAQVIMTCQFDILVYYDMSPDSTTDDLLQRIYNIACESAGQDQSDEDIYIVDKLRYLLKEKRYLVILGAISSKTILNCVRASLPDDNNGSSVLLILDTESEEVAWHANTMNKDGINRIHMLSRLDEKRSGELFCSMAFRKEQSNVKEDTSKYDKIVYDITGGYPLAIVLLAGLLRFKEKPGQWEAVLQQLGPGPGIEEAQGVEGNKIIGSVLSKGKHIEWQMSSITQANLSTRTTMLERVFWACFEDLPNDLKSCFLYLAAFPKNMGLSADEVVRMWMAEGFIKPQKGKTMEELGYNYLKELVLRCLVKIKSKNGAGIIDKFLIRRSLHGFLQSEAREAGFIDVHDMHDVFVPPAVRRLSFMNFEGGHMTFTNKFRKLRSFICAVKEKDQSNDNQGVNQKRRHDLRFLCGSKFLRLINVMGLRIKELPNEIGDMVHLRYLCIANCKDLKKLPSSIKSLLNLQTLDIMGTQVKEIHPSFWKIKTLRHVIADELMLPASIMEELVELQTLHGVKPAQEGEWGQGNCPLHKMTNLRSLYLHGFKQSKHGAALESALRKMSLLGNLKLVGDEIPSCVFTARSLRYLEMVELCGTIKWPEVASDVCKVRPNLVQLRVDSSEEVPQHIMDQLQEILEVPAL